MLIQVQPSQCFLDMDFEFAVEQPELILEQPELILWCKSIFKSNPTELGKVRLRLELSWGCDNLSFVWLIMSLGSG